MLFSMYLDKKCTHNLVSKLEGNRPLESPRCRWKVNINADLSVIVCECSDWS
jgi:hypothetical protein